jgi:exonuclease III
VLGAKLGRVIPAIATGHVWVNDAGGGITRPKFTYKLAWFDQLVEHAAELLVQDAPAVLAGDYNVVPTDFDIYATRVRGIPGWSLVHLRRKTQPSSHWTYRDCEGT